MIPHTKAFKRLKTQAQTTFDFAILVCFAVPSLKAALKGLDPGAELSFQPDYFDARPIATDKVRTLAENYKQMLSRQIFLSSFSFFEAYFADVLSEVLEFHGETALLAKHDLAFNAQFSGSEMVIAKRKLQEYRQKKDDDKYRKYGNQLRSKGFRFPSTILAQAGLKSFLKLASSDEMKSVQIPNFIESILQLKLDQKTEVERYDSYRKIRNKIAHGRPDEVSMHLDKAVEANNFLRDLALKVDKHILENLLLVEI